MENQEEILDIGCGHNPRGSVNLDRFPQATEHRSLDQRCKNDAGLKVKEIPNFIVADAQYLPFKDNAFVKVFSSHTIEHLPKPFLFMQEATRVTRKHLQIVCPHRLGENRKLKVLHINNFGRRWFVSAAKKLGLSILSCENTLFKCFPHPYVPIIRLPAEITLIAQKQRKNLT